MGDMPLHEPRSAKHSWRLQFSLRTLLVLIVTASSFTAGWTLAIRHQQRLQQEQIDQYREDLRMAKRQADAKNCPGHRRDDSATGFSGRPGSGRARRSIQVTRCNETWGKDSTTLEEYKMREDATLGRR